MLRGLPFTFHGGPFDGVPAGYVIHRTAVADNRYVWIMRLSDFITAHREPIMAEWEAFARTLAPASGSMNVAALRDHASEMLTVIVDDLTTP